MNQLQRLPVWVWGADIVVLQVVKVNAVAVALAQGELHKPLRGFERFERADVPECLLDGGMSHVLEQDG